MNIRIVNLRNYKKLHENEKLIKADRSSIVGNPFYMHNESERDIVCDKYEKYFKQQMAINKKFQQFIEYIFELSKYNDIALGCWCFPKRCHAETIMEYLYYLRLIEGFNTFGDD